MKSQQLIDQLKEEFNAKSVSRREWFEASAAIVFWVIASFFVGIAIAGCATTSSLTKSPDGTTLKSRAFVTSGSKITGKDLQQSVEVRADGSWKSQSGERTDSMESSTEAMMAFFRFASAIAPIAFPAPGPAKPSTFSQIDVNALVAAALDAYKASQE